MNAHIEDLSADQRMVRIGIVISDFYSDISDQLLAGALHILKKHPQIQYEVVRVAGTWEIPVLAKAMAQSGRFLGLIALGCVIRGETSHYDHLCQQSSSALMSISMEFTFPVGLGILTVEDMHQAKVRSNSKDFSKNKGANINFFNFRSCNCRNRCDLRDGQRAPRILISLIHGSFSQTLCTVGCSSVFVLLGCSEGVPQCVR